MSDNNSIGGTSLGTGKAFLDGGGTGEIPTRVTDDGGPAFPNDGGPGSVGMSLRDWFAGQAMNALVNAINSSSERAALCCETESETGMAPSIQTAQMAYELADAMLAARKAKP